MVEAALGHCRSSDPGRDVVLDAQTPLARWYAGFGFAVDGEDFLEDGILHTPMRLSSRR
jgi:ElaA protein